MMSFNQYKNNLLSILRQQIKYGYYVDVIYKNRLYRMHVEDLNTDVKLIRKPRKQNLVTEIKAKRCPACKKLMLNSVCMNVACTTNLSD